MQSRVINFLIITEALLYVPTVCMPTAMVLVPELSMSANKSHVLAHFYQTFEQLFWNCLFGLMLKVTETFVSNEYFSTYKPEKISGSNFDKKINKSFLYGRKTQKTIYDCFAYRVGGEQ